MNTKKISLRGALILRLFSFSTVLLFLSACASAPAPTSELQAAEQAISHAEKAQAANYAAAELTEARNKLASAGEAVLQKKMPQAQRLAVQSRLDAELALSKSNAAKAAAVNTDVQKGNESLKQEMQRNSKGDAK